MVVFGVSSPRFPVLTSRISVKSNCACVWPDWGSILVSSERVSHVTDICSL